MGRGARPHGEARRRASTNYIAEVSGRHPRSRVATPSQTERASSPSRAESAARARIDLRSVSRVRATEHAPRNPSHVLERRHGLVEIVERGVCRLVERPA